MTKKQKALIIIDALKKQYPEAKCSLIYDNNKPYELLIATRLSAQCTDERVNIVTKPMFSKYKSLEEFANAKLEDIEQCIKSCGLYKVKAKDILGMTKMLIEKYNSVLPNNMDELLTLPGIGRKTANLILGDIYKKPAIITDTHCIRITNRLSLTTGTNPLSVENQLKEILPPNESSDLCHRFVHFGREFCSARNPKCIECPLNEICKYKK